MSNYILFNYHDTPEDFYERLRINIYLNEEFKNDFIKGKGVKTTIYSFPMRFIPLDAKNRNVDTGNKYWNKRYLRGVQVILSVIQGPVMVGKQFFEQAFGRNAEEFKEILLMPDDFIRNRLIKNWEKKRVYESRLMPYVRRWKQIYLRMNPDEKKELLNALSSNEIKKIDLEYSISRSKRVKKMLSFHINAKEIVKKEKYES